MAERTGAYGTYYTGNYTAPLSEQIVNAEYFMRIMTHYGWGLNAICGMGGNFGGPEPAESSFNPGRWQGNVLGGNGYGIAQWTPASKFRNWATANSYDVEAMDSAVFRFNYELENHIQYFKTAEWPYTFAEFKTSTIDPYTLACVFARNYERSSAILAGGSAKAAAYVRRGNNANYWFSHFGGTPGTRPSGRMPIWMFTNNNMI